MIVKIREVLTFLHHLGDNDPGLTERTHFSAMLLFFAMSTIYAVFTYTQFSFIQIASTAILFLILVYMLTNRTIGFCYSAIRINLLEVTIVGFLVSYLFYVLVFYDNFYLTFYPNSPTDYLASDKTLHNDTYFNVAILHSVKNFGYPSTGLHGAPYMFYHALSYYVDSIMLKILRLDTFESIGLLFHFKKVIYLITLCCLFRHACRHKFIAYIIAVVFFLPVFHMKWSNVGSFPLWFTSIVFLVTVPWVYSKLMIKKKLDHISFVFIFLLLVLLSFGKVSLGFFYGLFVGFALLISRYKDWRVYFLGLSLISFYGLFFFMVPSSGEIVFRPSLYALGEVFFTSYTLIGSVHLYNFLLICAWCILALFQPKVSIRHLVYSSFISIIIFGVLVSTMRIIYADKYFYALGLLMVTASFFIYNLFEKYSSSCFDLTVLPGKKKQMSLIFAAATLIIFSQLNLSSVDLLHPSSPPFLLQRFPLFQSNTISKSNELRIMSPSGTKLKVIEDLTLAIDNKVERSSLFPSNSVLFVPLEIFQSFDLFHLNGYTEGMFFYALRGIPLLHGATSRDKFFGFRSYEDKDLLRKSSDLDMKVACSIAENILILDSISPVKLKHRSCLTLDEL